MALTPITPQDRLQRLGDLARKTWRYWWLMAIFAVAGGALSLVFAITRPKQFQSWTTLFYQERIESQLLSPNREEVAMRNIGDRYRELLLARAQLLPIVKDRKLDPFPKEKDIEIKIDKLRQAVRFVARGAMAFRIEYTDSDPDRAKAVTEKLTELLRSKEEALRKDQAQFTVQFASELKDQAQKDLLQRERDLNEFLAQNPAFAADTNAGNSEGAGIRAEFRQSTAPIAPRPMSTKERQLQRIRARLAAPGEAPQIIPSQPSPERIAAEAVVKDAQREVAAAKKELEEALGRFTEQHPSAIKAKDRLENAQLKLRQAEASVPPNEEVVVRPATAEDRAALEREMKQLEAEIAQQQAKSGAGKPVVETQDSTTKRVVELEIKNTELRRAVATQREVLSRATEGENRATMSAKQKEAEQGGRLSIIDPAFTPVKPSGPGKTIFLMGGMVLFIALGLSFAIGLAVLDDRVYRRADIDAIGVPVLAVIPPAVVVQARKSKPVKPSAKPRPQTKGDHA